MISSGIKRGLAGSAVAALAATGLPFLASSASAAGSDFTLLGTGPVLNGGAIGGAVAIKYPTASAPDLSKLALSDTALTGGTPNNGNQTVTLNGSTVLPEGQFPDTAGDGYSTAIVFVPVTTPAVGGSASFAIYDDVNSNGKVEASEPRVQVSETTSGKVAQITVTPSSQTEPAGQAATYAAALKDSAGRATQLNAGQSVDVTGGGATVSDSNLSAMELVSGSATFTATGPAVNVYNLTLATNGVDPQVTAHASLDVVKAATLTAGDVDIATAADTWDGFGDGASGGTTDVRVDQKSVRVDIASADEDDRGATVTFDVTSDSVTFGGKKTTTVTTRLDANGVGSVTITPDAASIQEGDSFSFGGNGFSQTVSFVRSHVQGVVPGAKTYVSAIDGSVTVTATVVDQFGLPVSAGEVSAARSGGPNTAAKQRKAVDANGQVSFTFTDADAVAGQTDTVTFQYFTDQYDASGEFDAVTKIKYTVDGQGADFTTRLDGTTASGTGYDPATNVADPLADAVADDDNGSNENMALQVVGAEPGAPITVSVDGGALILKPGQTLAQGKSSINGVVDDAGNLPGGYSIVGTKSGLVTVTVTAAGRTETSQFTVGPETDFTTARNVTVSGPADVEAGADQITYAAVVTDAFGNPVAGFPRQLLGEQLLNVTVSGPGHFQDGDTQTDTNGTMHLNVAVDADAVGDVSITVEGQPFNAILPGGFDQFGSAADQLYAGAPEGSAPGLPVSANVATATTKVMEAPVVPVVPVAINMMLSDAGSSTGKKDKIGINADSTAAGLVATISKGSTVLASHALNDQGDWTFKVADKNGNRKKKTYTVTVAASPATKAANKSITVK